MKINKLLQATMIAARIQHSYAFELVPDNFSEPETITSLLIEGKNITSIHQDVFKKYKNVTTVEIRNTSLTEFPRGLQNLQRLTSIKFNNNRSVEDYSNLVSLPCLSKFKIKFLELNDNNMRYIPIGISRFFNLTHLNLSGNVIENIDQELFKLEKLTFLDLSKNEISDLDERIGDLINLAYLLISQNRLIDLPYSFCFLQNLYNVDMSGNEFINIPIQVFPLQRLKVLDLSDNCLDSFYPDNEDMDNFEKYLLDFLSDGYVAQIENKQTILKDARRCLIHEFNSFFYKPLPFDYCMVVLENTISRSFWIHRCFPRLRSLLLNNNGLRVVPKEIKYFKALNEISLHNNMIETVSCELWNLPNITYINLSDNWLTYIQFSKQISVICMKTLILTDNFLKPVGNKQKLGISNLIKLGATNDAIGHQEKIRPTFENQNDEHLQLPKHWNLNEIWKIKTDEKLLENAAKIKDVTMKLMWDIVIQYLVYPIDLEEGQVKNDPCCLLRYENTVNNDEYENLIKRISDSRIIDKIKEDDENDQTTEDTDLLKEVNDYLKSICYINENSVENTANNQIIKAYIKLLFVHILKKVEQYSIEGDIEELNTVRTLVIEMCKQIFNSCVTGQSEKLQLYYAVFCLNDNPGSTIEQYLTSLLGFKKESTFMTVVTEDNDQNVHIIAEYRELLWERMGLIEGIPDPFPSKNNFRFIKTIGNKTKEFLAAFSIEKVINELLLTINKNKNKIGEILIHLENIMRKTHEATGTEDYLYNYVCTKYFEYEIETLFANTKDEEKVVKIVKLKPEGLERIFIDMNLIVNEEIKQTEGNVRKRRKYN